MSFLSDLAGTNSRLFNPMSGELTPSAGLKPGPQVNEAANTLAQISRQTFEEASPLRRQLLARGGDVLSGDFDMSADPRYRSMRVMNDAAYGRAKQNIMSSTQSGGGLVDALADLEAGRARDYTAGAGQLYGDELNRAFSVATGQTAPSLSGLGNAANIQQQQIAQQQAQEAQAKQGAGSAAGSIGAALIAGGFA